MSSPLGMRTLPPPPLRVSYRAVTKRRQERWAWACGTRQGKAFVQRALPDLDLQQPPNQRRAKIIFSALADLPAIADIVAVAVVVVVATAPTARLPLPCQRQRRSLQSAVAARQAGEPHARSAPCVLGCGGPQAALRSQIVSARGAARPRKLTLVEVPARLVNWALLLVREVRMWIEWERARMMPLPLSAPVVVVGAGRNVRKTLMGEVASVTVAVTRPSGLARFHLRWLRMRRGGA
jgi:hypothetical protein